MNNKKLLMSRREFLKQSGLVTNGLILTKLGGTSILTGLIAACGGGGSDATTPITSCSVIGDASFLFKWGANGGDGTAGTADGEFNRPLGIAINSLGEIYVADRFNQRIQKFDADGNFLLTWGTMGTANGEFDRPAAIAIDSADNVYVGENDSGNHRIQKFDANGTYITQWDGTAGAGGGLQGPNALAIDSNDDIYASDTWGYQIQKFDSDGNYITHFGSPGNGDGQFETTKGVAVDSNDNVYAASGDSTECRIMKFTSDGTFLGWWGLDDLGMSGWHDPGSGRIPDSGLGDGEFTIPKGVAVDKHDDVYVCDSMAGRIQKFTSNGTFLGWWGRDDLGISGWHAPGSGRIGSGGSGDGEFGDNRGPRDLAISPTNCEIYVSDADNHRIQVFS